MLIFCILINFLRILFVDSRSFSTVSHDLGISYGSFRGNVLCPDNSWLSSVQLFNSCSAWGTISITFKCSNLYGDIVSTLDFAHNSGYSSNEAKPLRSCPSSHFIISYNPLVMCCDWTDNDVGLNGLEMKCTDGTALSESGCGKGSWKGQYSCPVRTAGCGYNIKEGDVDDGDFAGDDLSIIDMKLLCCPICKVQNGFFLNNAVCEQCDDECLTCNGPNPNNCLTCGVSDTLTSGTCTHSSNFFLKEQIYYSGGVMPTGFTSSNAVADYDCGSIFKIIKITNNGNIQKLWTLLTPHYKIRIKARIYKLDNWAGESIEISIDGVKLNIPSLQSLGTGDKLFFDDICLNGGGSEDIIFVDQEAYHSGFSSLTLKFSSTGTKSFGVSSISLILYRCHPTCKTCIGPANTDCKTCFQSPDSTWESTTGKCFCNDGFLESVTTDCQVEICTVCQPCFLGCKKCTIQSSNTACNSCMPNYFYVAATHSCVANCVNPQCGRTSSWTCENTCLDPISEFIDPVDRICKPCDSTCYKCVDNDLKCTECTGVRYLTTDNNCVTMCPAGLYGVDETNKCESDCPDTKFKHDVDRKCYLNCPGIYYGNVNTKKCESSCPSGMYKDSSTRRCEFCYFNCKECTGSYTSCDSCKYSWMTGSSCPEPAITQFLDQDIFNTNTFTNADVTTTYSWSVSNLYGAIAVSDCSPYHLVGGSNVFSQNTKLTKSYTSLAEHFRARITFYLLKIDLWSSNKLIVSADTVPLTSISVSNEDSSIMKLCGNSNSEALRQLDISFLHSRNQLDIEITTDLSATTGSWGIRDLSVSIDKCDTTKCIKCNGPLVTDCLTCRTDIGVYLYEPPGPSTCQTSCKNGFYPDPITIQCEPCHLTCDKCDQALSTSCLTCKTGRFLVILNGLKSCETSCPPGTYKDTTNNICSSCDSSCNECSGPTPAECTKCIDLRFLANGICGFSCPDGTFARNDTNKCELTCPEKSFPDITKKVCVACDISCLTCSGMYAENCKTCQKDLILQATSCVSTCSKDYFFDSTAGICIKCVENCGVCSTLTTCSSCLAKSYLLIPENKTCVPCDKAGQLKDESTQTCYSCIGNCEKCKDGSSCEVCSPGNFQSIEKKCVQQKSLYATLKPMSLPTTVTISFSDTWPLLMNNFKSFCSLSIVGLDAMDFSYNFIKNSFLSFEGDFNLTFLKFVDSTNILNVIINKEDGLNDEFIIKDKKFSINLMPYCIPPTIYSKDIKKCIDTSFITPSLEYGTNSTTFILTFFKGYGDTYETYKQFTDINIEGYNKSVYSFSINRTESSPDIYIILLNFNVSVPNTPMMIINLNPTKSVFLMELQLSTYDLEIQLKNIYVLDESTAKLIESTKGATETVNSISGSAFAANNALTSGASFAFRCLASMDVIRFLRYFEIDYPPNVIAMFGTEMPKLDLIPNINFEENPIDGNLPDIFDKYGVSIYIFNNNGNQIIEILVYVFFGCISLLLYKYALHKITNKYLFYVMVAFKLLFVWGFSLSSFLGAYMLINFYTYLSFRFPTYTTTTGIINQVFSIIMGIFVLLFLPLLVLKIKKVMPLLKKKSTMTSDSNKIFPEGLVGVGILEHSISNKIVPADLEPVKEDKKKILKNSRSHTSNDATFDEDNSAKRLDHPVIHKSTYLKIKNMDSTRIFPEEISPGIKPDSGSLSFAKLNKNPTSNFIDSINIDNSSQLKKNDKPLTFEKLKKPNFAQSGFADEHSDTTIKKDTEPSSPDKTIKEGVNNEPDSFKNINKDNASQVSVVDDKNNMGLIGSSISPFYFKKDSFVDIPQKKGSLTTIKRLSKKVGTWFSMNKSEAQLIDKKKDNTDWKSSFNKDDEYRRYAPFYKDFKHLYSIQSYYIVFDLARQSLFSIILVMFFDSPFKGIVMINILNVFYFLILLTIKPFKVLGDALQAFINEFCLLTASICTLCLSIMDKFQIRDLELRINYGWGIVFSNYVLIGVFLIRVLFVLVHLFIVIMRAIYRYIVDKWKNRYEKYKEEELEDTIIEFDPKEEMEKINKYFD